MKNNAIAKIIVALGILLTPLTGWAQSAGEYFNKAARQYVNSDVPGTGQILAEGLTQYPNDPKLNALNEKLKKDQEEQKKDQQNQDQEGEQDPQEQEENENQQQKDGEGEEQTGEDEASEPEENKDQSGEKSAQEEPSDKPSDQESDLSEREKAMEEMRQKLQDMNITPEQAAQILEAMNNAELRYIQQNRKKPTQRPDRSLPDW
jgi:pyruvate/2-oxoglutarate dehydrogenase complex dihydrolipoamide acyltransferase (E2) component